MANTIDSGLLVDAMRGAVIGTLVETPIALGEVFLLDATVEPVMGGTATVPFVDTSNVSASSFTGGTYSNSDIVVSAKTVTLGEKYIEFAIPGYETQGYAIDGAKTIVKQITKKLVQEVENDIFDAITAQNFSQKEVVAAAANCSGSTIGALRTDLVKQNAGTDLACVLDPDYMSYLLADVEDTAANTFAADELNKNGLVAKVRGVKMYESNNLGSLKGFACSKDALVIKNVGVWAEQGVYDVLENFQDEKTGMVFALIRYAKPSAGGMAWRLSCRYGKAVGNASALYRVATS